MKRTFAKFSLVLLLAAGSVSLLFAWGTWGHKHISRAAVFALPESMRLFYYNHIDFITEGSVVPDLRKYAINAKEEAPRHFIDIEDFKNTPISELPKTTKDAYTKYDSNFLFKTGYLPWYIQNMTEKLTEAFKKRSKGEILFLSTELSHYIADAHMPLHTSSNYDGQKSNQRGVHALWESFLPQTFGDAYNFKVPDAKYVDDIAGETWKIISHSHSLIDSLLMAEKKVRDRIAPENRYKKDKDGNTVKFYNSPVFSDEYAQQFHAGLNGMIEKQLRSSISETADFWYTAWVNAGRPDLNSLDDSHLFKQNRKNYKKEWKAYTKGNLLNLSFEKE
ncbi:MAG: zinc dependent phospholipase C family protein [Ginsengibacter sp.]